MFFRISDVASAAKSQAQPDPTSPARGNTARIVGGPISVCCCLFVVSPTQVLTSRREDYYSCDWFTQTQDMTRANRITR